MNEDLIKRLRTWHTYGSAAPQSLNREAADALEAQAKRIAELEASRDRYERGYYLESDRADRAEADLAAARAALRTAESPSSEWDRRHAPAIAAARGEKEKTDVCPTCGNSRVDPGGLPVCRDCGTGKKETK